MIIRKKLRTVFLIVGLNLVLLLSIFPSDLFGSDKHFKLSFQYGNLVGTSFGASYFFNKNIGVSLVGGGEPALPLFWSTPYAGNVININVKSDIRFYSGFYVSPGWYAGLFNLTSKISDVGVSGYVWETGPTFALGFKLPNNLSSRRSGIEIGFVFNLPSKISVTTETDFETCILEAERGKPSNSSLLPFITFIIEL